MVFTSSERVVMNWKKALLKILKDGLMAGGGLYLTGQESNPKVIGLFVGSFILSGLANLIAPPKK